MPIEATANVIEAGLWFAVALTLLLKSIWGSRRLRGVFGFLSAAFVLFGATDLIESQTGAWWRPLWLLALKAACVVSFVLGFTAYYRIVRLAPRESDTPPADPPVQ